MNENEFPEEVIRHLRQMADEPPPEPSAALSEFLADPSSALAPVGQAVAMAGSGATGTTTHPTKESRMKTTKESRMKTLYARLGKAGRVALITAVIGAAGVGTAAATTAVNLVTDDEPTSTVEVPAVPADDEGDDADDQGDDSATDDQGDDGDNNQGDDSATDDQGDDGDDNQGDDGDDQGDNDQGDDNQGDDGDDQGDSDDDSDDDDSDDSDDSDDGGSQND